MNMIRRFLNLAAIVSMLLCGGLIVLRFRSSVRSDNLVFAQQNGRVLKLATHDFPTDYLQLDLSAAWPHPAVGPRCYALNGKLSFSWVTAHEGFFRTAWFKSFDASVWCKRWIAPEDGGYLDALPVPLAFCPSVPMISIRAPLWMLIALTASLPSIRLLLSTAVRRRRRSKAGCCINCGYDLRASIERCPECGRLIPST
jgi:hypothetical protein